MPIKIADNFDMFASWDRGEVNAIVNPVNCVGTMGKGIAKGVQKRFPRESAMYRRTAKAGHFRPGYVLATYTASGTPMGVVYHMATKDHWRQPSELLWIDEGLSNLSNAADYDWREKAFHTLCIPAVGCGNGGLAWSDVLSLVNNHFSGVPYPVIVVPPLEGT